MMKKLMMIVMSMLIFFGCKTSSYYAKEWYNKPPYNFDGEQLSYKVVSTNDKEKYIEILLDTSFCIVEKDEYTKITGEISSKKYVIALRALYTNEGGVYQVKQNDNTEIAVNYFVLGSEKDVHKSVLFVEVDNLPSNIYVSYTTAR